MGIAGLVGMLSFHEGVDVVKLAKYSLMALGHRGSRGHWVAALDKSNKLTTLYVDDPRELLNINIDSWACVGCVLGSDSPHDVVDCGQYKVAYCAEGVWPSEGEVCGLLRGEVPRVSAAIVALSSGGELIGLRPMDGLRNLFLGSYGFDLAIMANEAPAITVVGGSVRRLLSPGSMVKVSRLNLENKLAMAPTGPRACSLELLYLSRPDSVAYGASVYGFRVSLAKRLAAKVKVSFDIVVGVPETGVLYAIKLAEALGKPVELALVPTVRRRSALEEDLLDRLAAIQLKASPVGHVLRGKRVLLVDDSLISGLTIKALSQLLRHRSGVKEVHVAIASPRIRSRCPYGVEMPPEEQMLANAFPREEDVTRLLEVDSVTWLDIEDLIGAAEEVGLEPRNLCMECLLPRR